MTEKLNYNWDAFIRFVICTTEFISSDKQHALEYLNDEGLKTEEIVSDGLKRIKQIQLKLNAEKTRIEMTNMELVSKKATVWVDKIIADVNFSFPDFVKKEKLVLQNRNLSSLSKEDIRNTLIKYYTLKFIESRTESKE